jgi:phospholipase/carboxylesterase
MLETLEIAPPGPARRAVIWLHGLGADGHDFEPLVRDWGLAEDLAARFVLPHAPLRPVTLNGGMVMRAWYDLYDLNFASGEDREGIESARQHLLDLIAREQARGIASEHIVLAGFSQGGAVALHTGLGFPQPLAGVLALSSYLPLADGLPGRCCADPGALAIRMDHGDSDQVVPFGIAERSCALIQAQGYQVEFHRYAMQHSLCPDQIPSLRDWLVRRLGTDVLHGV